MTTARAVVGVLFGVSLVATALLGRPAFAEQDRTAKEASPLQEIAKDLGLNPLDARPDGALRLSLAPRDWTLLRGIQPYAAVQPRTLKPVMDPAGLAAPERDYTEDSWKGVGLGAGIKWHLSDRVDLRGEYLFQTNPGATSSSPGPFVRPDADSSPGLKGSFSIQF